MRLYSYPLTANLGSYVDGLATSYTDDTVFGHTGTGYSDPYLVRYRKSGISRTHVPHTYCGPTPIYPGQDRHVMSSPHQGESSQADRSSSPPRIRFVAARPDSKQARQEARAAIRAHASKASWARIRREGKQVKQKASAQTGVTRQDHSVLHTHPNIVGESAGTVSMPASNDGSSYIDDSSNEGSSSWRHVVPSRATRRALLELNDVPSPFETVGLGDFDPFTTYPSDLPKEIAAPFVDQVNHFYRIVFMPGHDPAAQRLFQRWISWYMGDRAVFHANIYAQIARSSATDHQALAHNEKVNLYCYSQVVREINKRIGDPSQHHADENLFAVLSLAFHGATTVINTDTSRLSQGPLNGMQGLDLYAGPLHPVSMHVNGLAKMIAARGGLAGIKFPALAPMLSYGDLLWGSRTVQRPSFSFVSLGESPERTLTAVSRTEHPLAQLGSGFRVLHDLLSLEAATRLIPVLQDLSTYSLAVDDYIMGRAQAPPLRTLANQRNFVHHSLMSLSSNSDYSETGNEGDPFRLEDACWTAAAVYSLIAVFPVPSSVAPFARLAHLLKRHLIHTSAPFAQRWQTSSPLFLWMTLMGALAATANDESKDVKTWYVVVLERLVHRMQISSWQMLREQLLNFLWFPSTSDTDGQQLWREIHTSNPFT